MDLYAGTGAVGIEAISRGAAHVWFAENGAPAVASIRANLAALKISAGYSIEDRGVGALWPRMDKLAGQIDVVFLDPPYEAEAEYLGTLGYLGSVKGRAMLAPGAVVVAEHASRAKMPERFGGLSFVKVRKQGDVSLSFYEVGAEE